MSHFDPSRARLSKTDIFQRFVVKGSESLEIAVKKKENSP